MKQDMEVFVARRSDLRRGERRRVVVDGTDVLLVVLETGELCAIDEACPHHGASLLSGYVSGSCIECPWHHWRIDLHSGGVAGWPGPSRNRFAVLERDGDVFVTTL